MPECLIGIPLFYASLNNLGVGQLGAEEVGDHQQRGADHGVEQADGCGVAELLAVEGHAVNVSGDNVGGFVNCGVVKQQNLVIADILKARLNRGKDPGLYFIRDSKGVEIDLVVEDGRALDLYEIKSSASFSADFARNIEKYAELIPEVRNKRVVYSGKPARKGSVEYIPFTDEKE